MRPRVLGLATIGALALSFLGPEVRSAQPNDELEAHLATLRKEVEDPSVGIARREQVAMEMAATLDRAAKAAPTAVARRARWTEAITLLDRFRDRNPGHPQERQFQFQSAVFLWARARLWAEQGELSPNDREARGHAIENFDAAIGRLRALDDVLHGRDDALAENVRFRLAQTLADRAELDAESSGARRAKETEALRALDPPMAEPSLQGFAHLLRGVLLGRLGEEAKADAALAEAAKAVPAPPLSDLLEARVTLLLGRKRFADALRAVDAARADEALKGRLAVRVLLARRRDMEPGPARSEAESTLFRRVQPLRTSTSPDAKLALMDLARGIDEPDANQGPDAWETLAEGAVALGDLPRAAALEGRGPDRAEATGSRERATALRLKAGALLFQAEAYLQADAVLSRVADDPRAGPSRPRAGFLRVLARGRALATRQPGASQASYASALEAQIRDFPADPSANEARWLLGKLRLATGDRDAARTLWAAVPEADPHWLDARLAVSALLQDDLDTQRINNDRAAVRTRYEAARSFLSETLSRCRSSTERAAVDLTLARLELTPDAGRPDEARALCEGVLRSAGQAEQQDRARRLRLVAMAAQGHFVEAETEARAQARRTRPHDLLETARLLDYLASESSTDLRMRRLGLILRILMDSVLEREDLLPTADRSEARIRQIRALILIGDDDRARASLSSWSPSIDTFGDRLFKDLADTYYRLDAYPLAADVQRVRAQRAANGSLPWFEARYGLALAYYRSGKEKDARTLIDATSILHPDLGGGELREKFVRLRQRLEPGG